MNNYSSQYRDYYNSIINSKKKINNSNNLFSRNIGKRLIRELTGVLILFVFVIACKAIRTPRTQAVYEYSKKIVKENYDYKQLVYKIKDFDYKGFEKKVEDYIDKIESKIKGNGIVKEVEDENFLMPCNGVITSGYGKRTNPVTGEEEFHEGIDIEVDKGTPVIAPQNGRVKLCGNDEELGNYIIIDHGSGIETKYAHLDELDVEKGDIVNRGDVIGKSGSTGRSTGPHLHFEIMYMGRNLDPKLYLNTQ